MISSKTTMIAICSSMSYFQIFKTSLIICRFKILMDTFYIFFLQLLLSPYKCHLILYWFVCTKRRCFDWKSFNVLQWGCHVIIVAAVLTPANYLVDQCSWAMFSPKPEFKSYFSSHFRFSAITVTIRCSPVLLSTNPGRLDFQLSATWSNTPSGSVSTSFSTCPQLCRKIRSDMLCNSWDFVSFMAKNIQNAYYIPLCAIPEKVAQYY